MTRFLISDFQTGLETDKKPFLLPEDAFPLIEDAYVFRGRIQRKPGFSLFNNNQLNSRLRINIGTTDGAGAFAGNVPGAVPIPSAGRQQFSIGTEIMTCNNAGAGAQVLLSTGAAAGTLNNTTGAVAIAGAAITTAVYYYPTLPVMGLRTRETATINFEECVAFDTQFAYHRVGTGWDIMGGIPPAAGSSLWTGNNHQFYWTTNYRATADYQNNFYVVNGNAADNIRYYNDTTLTWTNLRPQLDSGGAPTRYLETCKILIPFRNRLVALNTIEEETGVDRNHPNRVRWSQNGDPTAAATSWVDDVDGRGDYLDAPTSEAIVSAQFVENRLIIFFERSTWELVYTGNEIFPFILQRINTELGCESTFSEVAFDQFIMGVGERGIHLANLNTVQRTDIKIIDYTRQINNSNNGPERVYGIRDFSKELIMWTYPLFGANQTFPNKVLIYNYRNNSYSEFNESFTCFGYFQRTTGLTWATLPYGSWLNWNVPWNNGISQTAFPMIIAGNQQGWTLLYEDATIGSDTLIITDVTIATNTITSPDHNLSVGQYVSLNDVNGITITGGPIFEVTSVPTANTFTIDATAMAGVYTGGGTVQIRSNFNITTKTFQLFADAEKSMFVQNFYIFTENTPDGEYTLNLYQDDNEDEAIVPSIGDSSVRTKPEDNNTFSVNQKKIWHKVHRTLVCQSFNMQFTLSDDQMRDTSIQASPFILHGIEINAEPTGRL